MLEETEGVTIAVVEIVKVRFLRGGGERDDDAVVRDAEFAADLDDDARVGCHLGGQFSDDRAVADEPEVVKTLLDELEIEARAQDGRLVATALARVFRTDRAWSES